MRTGASPSSPRRRSAELPSPRPAERARPSRDPRFLRALRDVDPELSRLLKKVPLDARPPLAPEWMRCEMLERHRLLEEARILPGTTVLEVGAGPHALTTVPLAFAVGPGGRAIVTERARWGRFREIIDASGLGDRLRPITCDARRLPLRPDSVDLTVCVHAVRSLVDEAGMRRVFREMLRVAPRLFVAETLPIARSDAQRAHLAMYDLREPVFEATTGRKDDLHYLPLERLERLIEGAGGTIERRGVLEPDLPHALAYFPLTLVEAIPVARTRSALRARWRSARRSAARFGTDHPPVGFLSALRRPPLHIRRAGR